MVRFNLNLSGSPVVFRNFKRAMTHSPPRPHVFDYYLMNESQKTQIRSLDSLA